MKATRCALLLAIVSSCLVAHPMGNFSINHYTKIELNQRGPSLTYVLDFAEIPTSELFGGGTAAVSNEAMKQSAVEQAAAWGRKLAVTMDSKPQVVKWSSVEANTLDGAGGMAVMRVVMKARLSPNSGGTLAYEDGNFANRTGWKEVVVAHSGSVEIVNASHSDADLSKALTTYPADLTITPPQDLTASVSWRVPSAPLPQKIVKAPMPLAPIPDPQPQKAAVVAPFSAQQPTVAGTLQRGDYLSRMLKQKHFGFSALILGLLAAFGLGAMHALSPGHGKTIVAAYLVGSRGTLKHAGILGLTVTFTHTISVFLLGLGVLFFQQYVIPERVVPVLAAISGISIMLIGAYLLYKRAMALGRHSHDHDHHEQSQAHHHHHEHGHSHSHSHSHPPAHTHTHSHGGHTHTHQVPEHITMGSLLGLGVSGGLVPCPSALVLLLSAISLGQTALGLALLGAFSTGLAMVLMAVGGIVLYGKSLLPRSSGAAKHPIFRLLPVFSSVVVIFVGLLMTLTAVGVIQPVKLFS